MTTKRGTPFAIHSPRYPRRDRAADVAPDRSWWADADPVTFYQIAREEYDRRMRLSERTVGDRGVDG